MMSKIWWASVIKLEFSFDDGSIYDLRIADMLNGYGYKATFYIPVNWQRYLLSKGIEPLTPENLIHIASQFTLGSHGVNHTLLTQSSEKQQRQEIFESKKYWEQQGYTIDSFCYPRGYYNDEIKDMVKEAGYKIARTVKVGYLEPADDPYEKHTTVHIGYDRDEYETDWLTYAKNKVTEAIEKHNNGEDVIYHAWGHSEELRRYQQFDRFAEFLKYLTERLRDEDSIT